VRWRIIDRGDPPPLPRETTAVAVTETIYAVRRLTLTVSGVRVFQRACRAVARDGGSHRRSSSQRFLIYFRDDVHPVMRSAGDEASILVGAIVVS
jgi:hypothetical protein